MEKKIALAGPYITKKEEEYVVDAVRNGWYETYDMHINRLEETFCNMFANGEGYSIATYCGTHALHLATLALGLGMDDEVIVTDQSYIATANSVSYVGAKCVFVDIEADTLCIDPTKIEEAITEKTKAIMVVHFAGFAADMDKIMSIAREHNLYVIEDACQAVGTKYKGKYCGTIADIGVFSFQGSKICVGGEGGMFFTKNKKLYEKAHHFGTFCRNDKIAYLWSDDIGYNYRISNVTAALILAQVERINELVKRKKEIYQWYKKYTEDIGYLSLIESNANCETNYAYTVGYLDPVIKIERDELISKMQEHNIYMRPGYPSMSLMPGYERRFPVPNSDYYYHHGIVFPTAMNIEEEDVKRVVSTIREIVE